MPGIPEVGTPAADAFWAAFWPALWSGAIYSIICGIVVGIIVGAIVLRFQSGSELRASERAFNRDLSILLDALRNALAQRDGVDIGSAKDAIPSAAGAALEVLRQAPLTLWREALPKQSSILDAAIDLQKRSAEFVGIAIELDRVLQQAVRAFNHARGAIAANDGPYRRFGVGRLLGIPGEQLLPWISSYGPGKVETYDQAWEKIGGTLGIAELGAQFRASRDAVSAAAESLKRAVNA
jgi:hypothetical protein